MEKGKERCRVWDALAEGELWHQWGQWVGIEEAGGLVHTVGSRRRGQVPRGGLEQEPWSGGSFYVFAFNFFTYVYPALL